MRNILWLIVLFIFSFVSMTFADDEIDKVIKKAESGDATAQTSLGFMYSRDDDSFQDYKKAFEWFEKAAMQGDAYGQYGLAMLYDKGNGVPKDSEKAAKWYKKAAVLFEKAAMQGDDKAQFMLGSMYNVGAGVPKDKVMAYAYINISASAGNAKFIEQRDLLQKKMTQIQIENAQELCRELFKKINESNK